MLDSASAHLKSFEGMTCLAISLYEGTGIEQNESEAVKFAYKALEGGFLDKDAKKMVDEYFKKNAAFRK